MPLDMIISPLALYEQDQSIFEGLVLPTLTDQQLPSWGNNYLELLRDNLAGMDKDTFVQWLLLQTAEMSTIYPSPSIFKQAVTLWSSTRARIWQQLWETQFFRYNPIWNKDGTIKLSAEQENDLKTIAKKGSMLTHGGIDKTTFGHPTETLTRKGGRTETVNNTEKWKESRDGDDTRTDTYKHTDTESFNNYKETHKVTKDDTDGNVAAFDAQTLQPREQTKHQLEEETTPSGQRTRALGGDPDTSKQEYNSNTTREKLSGNIQTTYAYDPLTGEIEERKYTGNDESSVTHGHTEGWSGQDETADTGKVTHDDTTLEQGNIGVTSTQELIEKEREVLRFNMYDYILQDFKQNFLIMLY